MGTFTSNGSPRKQPAFASPSTAIYHERLQDLTESYLRRLIAEHSDSSKVSFDSFAPFGELGINSFRVLKIIKKLEVDFGTLPKSLLFEHFNINDLAKYFVGNHEQTLSSKFAGELHCTNSRAHTNGYPLKAMEVLEEAKSQVASGAVTMAGEAVPIRILEKEAYTNPEFQDLVQTLFGRYKTVGSVSRGTRKIAPNLFIGSTKRGFFHYGRNKNIVLVYAYTGPREYLRSLMEEMYQYCFANNFQLNILADEEIPSIAGRSFSATPFGVLQRIENLKEFSLEGGTKRRLRYQVSKFKQSGACKTEEYQCGSNPETDRNICGIIDRWCESKTMVNPLVHDVKEQILAGTLQPEHRLFLTYLDNALENVILITEMSSEENGYLMDLEFYPADMPSGGLEFAILQIIDVLAGEGCNVLHLGGTYGCKLNSSAQADPEIENILDDLREHKIFNDEGNFQFKNKFRPENKPVFLCRAVGSGNPENVIDIIMMIADPSGNQMSDEEKHDAPNAPDASSEVDTSAEEPTGSEQSAESSSVSPKGVMSEARERSRILSRYGLNPLNVPHELVEFDLMTDSWAQLHLPSIEAQMRRLHAQLQEPSSVDESLRQIFPFAYFILTASGQAAENIFFRAWPKKGIVLQNLLFPSTIFHEIDKGFSPRELPHAALFQLTSQEKYKGNMNWEALQAEVAHDPNAISLVCIEANNNAAGGQPISIQHLRDVKALLAEHSIPLVIDGTRVLENAQFLIEQEKEYAGKGIWAVVSEIFSYADVVIGSLTKDFCVIKGGIIAANDVKLFQRLEQIVDAEGAGIDLIDRKMIGLALQDRTQIETKVLRRMEGVRLIAQALGDHRVPVVQPAGGHCVLIDVKQIPEFKNFKYPVASFLAWMYVNSGIRAGAHSVGMQEHSCMNDVVRLAIPVGLKRNDIERVISRLIHLFENNTNIPEVTVMDGATQPSQGVLSSYKLIEYRPSSGTVLTQTRETSIVRPSASVPSPGMTGEPQSSSAIKIVTAKSAPKGTEASPMIGKSKPLQRQDVAIVGMAGRYPKAKNVYELWTNLTQGRDCIECIPADRYERLLQHGAAERYHGGFIDDIDKFDSLFFNISPREAEMLDPQERLFLEVAWEAIEDAGYYPEILAREDGQRNIGVFVGAVWAMYQMLGVEERNAGNKIAPNSFLWSIANRVSYCMNLSGPSMTLDTACSSSLTALYLACEAIYGGECAGAIVGGVNLDMHPAKLDINLAGGALSVDGVCRSFGKHANGYVAGEGVGALFLKPFDQAVQDRDHIYAIIKSAVVNHGGRTSGYTVPNPKAQSSLILETLRKGDIDARTIGYVEAHGTGTALGDPIEITGLTQAFQSYEVNTHTCAIGSIKTNIGHLEAAAGIASVSKVLLQMKHRQFVPSLHSAELNEFIDFDNSPFYVEQRLEDWKEKEVEGVSFPLRAGVSSFGAGGSNAHVILESYAPHGSEPTEPDQPGELIFPLSAKSEKQLRDAAARLAHFMRESDDALADVAYTLQIGRKSFDNRLAIMAKTRDELVEKLFGFVDGKEDEDTLTGHMNGAAGITRLLTQNEQEGFLRLLAQRRDPRALAELWVSGLAADWRGLRSDCLGKRVSLPTYPFADKRHWAFKGTGMRHTLPVAASIHPLLDSNESTFDRQLFKKRFHLGDFFICDHRVAEIPTLPGVAYLELARKAGELAAGKKVQKIKNILWISPIAVHNSKPKEVFIELKSSGDSARFEVFSHDAQGSPTLHSQGILLYATSQEMSAEPIFIDLAGVRASSVKVMDGPTVYPLFRSFGLSLGSSFQVLEAVYKNDNETLGVLKLPEFHQRDLESMTLHPSLVDGSLQAGMAARLSDTRDEIFVPFSIGEVEVLHPLQSNCFSYVTEVKGEKKPTRESARLVKSNVLIVDETGKVLVKIKESVGVPLREVREKALQTSEASGFSTLYYSYPWKKAPPAVEAGHDIPSSILLFDRGQALRDRYEERLRNSGRDAEKVIWVRPGERFDNLDRRSYIINPNHAEDFDRLFQSLLDAKYPVENICFAWPSACADLYDTARLEQSLAMGVYSFLKLCQSVIKHKLEGIAHLLYLYSAAPGGKQLHNEAVGGFVKALRLEHPRCLCKTVEVGQQETGPDSLLDAIAAEWQTPEATVVRYDAHERYVKELEAFIFDQAGGSLFPHGVALRKKGVYVISGGAGGLGLIFAGFLAKQYQARLVLTGRSSLSVQLEASLEEFAKAGGEVLYLPADIANREGAQHVVRESKARFGEINGIIHAAGVLRDSYIRNKTLEEMKAVVAPKVYGALYLDEATKEEKLDFFIMFSSLAAVTGNAGQCDYSFANHFLDLIAEEREQLRAKSLRAGKSLSINWSLWADGGMKVDEHTALYFKRTLGVEPLSRATGLEAFVKGLASERVQFAVLEGVRDKVEVAWGMRQAKQAPPKSLPPTNGKVESVANAGEVDLREWIEGELSQIISNFLKIDASDISADKILLDLGFDSLGLTTFANSINDRYQLDLTPVQFFDYPAVGEIAKYLAVDRKNEMLPFYRDSAAGRRQTDDIGGAKMQPEAAIGKNFDSSTSDISKDSKSSTSDGKPVARASYRSLSPERRFVDMPIAIVGMSGVMPQSDDLEMFWENLEKARDLVTIIPKERWNWENYYGDPLKEINKSNSKWGAFMNEIDKFDPLFFGISPREAQMMDPQQRIFLQTVWKTIEDSGQKVSDFSGTRTGVFVGSASNDYVEVMRGLNSALDGYSASGNSHSVLANRVSFLLNLRGPSAPIDTACSSSLIALHRATESIHTGSCDMAIVGGVQVLSSPAAFISFAVAGMLSSEGKCRTFDKRANGYVRGEGCGAVLLKPLAAAEADGNHIYAVIRGTAENHGGRVPTMTAPNAAAQAALLIEAYEKAQIDPATVGYIECHGTGTSLGDPIEVQGLTKAFAELYKRRDKSFSGDPHCGLSSVKTNIGHLETAAGIAGVLKVLLAIRHKHIPANIHFEELNPYINLKESPFYVVDKHTPWAAPTSADGKPLPRRAGVNSFGFGGANAHVVLEEYVATARPFPKSAQGPQLIVLSAKNEDRLKDGVQSLRAFLDKGEVALTDLAYTLQVGRDEMPERLALIVFSQEELKRKLAEVFEGGERPSDCYREHVKSSGPKSQAAGVAEEVSMQTLIGQKNFSRLAELWVSGAKIEWPLLYDQISPRRISAPTYPFARERCWITGTEKPSADARHQSDETAPAFLHPLVHRNVSTLKEQKFACRFTGKEFFLADHSTARGAVFPAAAFMQMVATAGELSGEQPCRQIRNMAFLTPLVVRAEARELDISLTPAGNEFEFVIRAMAEGQPVTHCKGTLAYSGTVSGPDALNVSEIQRRCSGEVIAGKELYAFLCSSELKFGKGFQVVQKVFAGRSECLAILELPEHLRNDADRFSLHPALLDGGMHAAVGIVTKHKALPWTVPYSLSEVQIIRSLRDVYYAHGSWDLDSIKDENSLIRIDVSYLDRSGTCLVKLRGLTCKAFPATTVPSVQQQPAPPRDSHLPQSATTSLQHFVPVWKPVRIEPERRLLLPESTSILLLRNDSAQVAWVQKTYPNAQSLPFAPSSSREVLEKHFADCIFDQLLWIAPDATSDTGESPEENSTIDQQEEGVLALFGVIKALLHAGYANKNLRWTIVTSRTQRVKEADRVQPAHAAIAGLVGSLAKEYPQWDLRLVDVDSLASVSAGECLSLPWDKQGDVLAYREGEWFQAGLARMASVPETEPVYRKNGVYVVIGGAGGIGKVWTQFMMKEHQAQVVWIGRRPWDATIEAEIQKLSRFGKSPLYIAADATNPADMERCRETVLKTYSTIHGVVHSAIVLHDQSLARMEEAAFRASLAAKVDISVNMHKIFGEQKLDFMLLFSSMISFVKAAGQSNYSAGCTFKDSYGHYLQQRSAYPVKIMNWGYWGKVGVVADESYNKAMARLGIASIEPDEGMASLQMLLGSDVHQMALVKTLDGEAGIHPSDVLTHYPRTSQATVYKVEHTVAQEKPARSTTALEATLPTPEMNDLVTRIVGASLLSVGLFTDHKHTISDLSLSKPPAPYYEQWLSRVIAYLQEHNLITEDLTFQRETGTLAVSWAEWKIKRTAWASNPNLEAQIALLEACLKALPEILTGKRLATDAIFPNSSMQLVEGLYQGNPQADFFNEVLAETLVGCIEQKLKADKESEIRILEVGAGTGGTTAKLLPLLLRFPIAEYCYTDVSRAFLMHADKHYKSGFPALTTAIFDVSKPAAWQSVATNHYDFAIAANVLHATPDIRETVRNVKATLKNQGALLLNEIGAWSLFNHLTFGLLEGWWLCQDTAVRLPGSPGLAPGKWREILADEGFESIFYPAEEAHRFGQQIVAAVSNGWVRQRIGAHTSPQVSADVPPAKAPGVQAPGHTPGPSQTFQSSSTPMKLSAEMTNDYVQRIIREKLSQSLKLDAAMIRNDTPFADYGVDSIIGVNLVRTINEALQIELETPSLFEYTTVGQLTDFIANKWRDQFASQLEGVPQSPSASISAAEETPAESDGKRGHRFLVQDQLCRTDSSRNAYEASEPRMLNEGPIAIIGMGGRFAQSESLEDFWENLIQGKDLVEEVSRWSPAECALPGQRNQKYCGHGSFIDSIDQFDPAFFGISPEEAIWLDPQQRLFLEEAWKALEDAGYADRGAQEKRCGVYVGCGTSNYERLFETEVPPQAIWGNLVSIIPARIAYHLNLQGPAIAINTACSSSLVAIHLACQGLWSGETEMALAGGVFLQATPGFHQMTNRAGLLSPEGKCYSFDARANGFVPGEGVGVVVLKRLRDALEHGDHIHGVIVGSGINQDGSSNGLVAPNGRAQERLQRSIYERFKIQPETIQVVEAHGTGTTLGDSIEFAALSRSFGEYTQKKQFCCLGTVKTNVGHTAEAAGMASVLKLLLSMRHRQIPPTLNFQTSNAAIDLASSPFYLNTETKEWSVEQHDMRRAAINSFGYSGTNAHLVLEDAPPVAPLPVKAPAFLVTLSARTSEQLRQHASNLLAMLKRTPDLSMNDLSFSLLVGRMQLAYRLACVARSQEELTHQIEQWLEIGEATEAYCGDTQESRVREHISLRKFGNHCIDECRNGAGEAIYLEHLATIADLYSQGYSLDFPALFPRGSRRMPLPTYPFARERYWIGKSVATATETASCSTAILRPQQWQFIPAPAPGAVGGNGRLGGMDSREKMELFLRQEVAGQVEKRPEEISIQLSYFDLGLSSLGAANVVQKLNQLLGEDILPSALFQYTNIESLAAYLSESYPAKIVAIKVISETRTPGNSGEAVPRATITHLPQRRLLYDQPAASTQQGAESTAKTAVSSGVDVLEKIRWQETLLDDSVEILKF
jgi:acyl transferase domain-containing protein/tryptophanase/acyl carrier protein/SAM-dependent methyltransferase